MGKKSMVLLACLVMFVSSVVLVPEQEGKADDTKKYERFIGKLPKPVSFQWDDAG